MRIMQICQASYEKLKQHSDEYDDAHAQFKAQLTQNLQLERVELAQLSKTVLSYSRTKFEKDVTTLVQMIDMIENGQKEMIGKVLQQRDEHRAARLKKLQEEEERKKQLQLEAELRAKREREKAAQQIRKIKEQAQAKENVKKKKNKFVERVFLQLYSVVDLHKPQLLEDLVFMGQEDEHMKKLCSTMRERNKDTEQEIRHFAAQENIFKEKVRKFKQMMLAKSTKSSHNPELRTSALSLPKPQPTESGSNFQPNSSVANFMVHTSSTDILPPAIPPIRPLSRSIAQSPVASDRPENLTSLRFFVDKKNCSELSTNTQTKLTSDKLPLIGSIGKHQNVSATSSNSNFHSTNGQHPSSVGNSEENYSRQRYHSVVNNKRSRYFDLRSSNANQHDLSQDAIFKAEPKLMQVPLIQLNMVSKFDFKVSEGGATSNPRIDTRRKKDVVISRAFEYQSRKIQSNNPVVVVKRKSPGHHNFLL